MSKKSQISWARAALLALAMTVLGRAVQVNDGSLGQSPYSSIAWLTIAIAITALALFLPGSISVRRAGEFQFIVAVCVLVNVVQLAMKMPHPPQGPYTSAHLVPFVGGLAAMIFLSGIVLMSHELGRLVAFTGLLAAVAFLGNWVVLNSPNPEIDVYMFQVDSAQALSNGQSPYGITFNNIYQPGVHYYGEGLEKNGRLQFGYPYLPETLFAVMPAALLHLDIRYAHLAAILLSAIFIVVASPDVLGFSAAILLLSMPSFFFVLEQSWIEPFTVLALAATIACAAARPRLLPLALGLFLASKQYAPATVPLFFMGSRPVRATIRLVVQAAIVALVVTAPLALWDPAGFWRSTVMCQIRQPFRGDSLSYLAWVGEASLPKPSQVFIPFVLLLASIGIALRQRRSIGFAAATAFCLLVFFAFNKQAFANYYFFVAGALACGIAELRSQSSISNVPSDDPLHGPDPG